MTVERRRYSAEQRAEATGLALSVGVKEAGRRLSIPHRTVSHWLARPDAQVQRIATEADLFETSRTAAFEGMTGLLRIIRDPKASDRDKVRATEVATDRYLLLSGQATARTQSFNVNATVETPYAGMTPEQIQARWTEEDDAATFYRTLSAATDDELGEWLASQNPAALKASIEVQPDQEADTE